MNPTVYQVEKDGKFTTVKSFNSPVGVCRGLFRIPGRYIPTLKIDNRTTIVNENIIVKIVDVSPMLVRWCPQQLERVDAYQLPKVVSLV